MTIRNTNKVDWFFFFLIAIFVNLKDFYAILGLNGAMSNITMGFSMSQGATASPQIGALPKSNGNMEELNRFILDEFSRNYDTARKRTSSPDNTLIDSPSRKKSRLF